MELVIKEVNNGYHIKHTPSSSGFGREWVAQRGTDDYGMLMGLLLSLEVLDDSTKEDTYGTE